MDVFIEKHYVLFGGNKTVLPYTCAYIGELDNGQTTIVLKKISETDCGSIQLYSESALVC